MSTFLEDFGDLLHDAIVIKLLVSRSQVGGTPSYGSPVTAGGLGAGVVQGRWVRRQRLVRDATGAILMSSSFVRIPPITGLTPEAQVTLPDGSRPLVVAVETMPDEDGLLYAMRVSFQ